METLMQRFALFALLALAPLAFFSQARGDDDPKPAKKKPAQIAHIRLHGDMDEAPVMSEALFGAAPENFKIRLDRIDKAAKDTNVQALFIQLDELNVGFAKLAEIRSALEKFRKTGKKVYAYLESSNSKDYLAALAADVVCMPESGGLMIVGMRAEILFFKELLEKLGIKADFLQMGVFKSAAEPYTRTKFSPEAKEQYTKVIDDFFINDYVRVIAKQRSKKGKELSDDQVRKIVDTGLFSAKDAKALGLVDQITYFTGVEELIKKDLGVEETKVLKDYGSKKADDVDLSNPFAIFKLLAPPKTTGSGKKDRIALIYAVGAIVDGKSSKSFMDGSTVGSTTMVDAIRQADADPKVKAIVLRVDSPGGSALASDLIWNELKSCKKPVVASMSDTAASGGYYISMGAKKVYAQPGTLTGSIGVVGGKLALKGLMDKVGVTTDVISRGANSGLLASKSEWTEGERTVMQKHMEDIYDLFLKRVLENRAAAGKKMTRDDLIKLAEGRIWTGRQALQFGLVDTLGSLEDAIDDAKQMAGLAKGADVDYLILPKAGSFLDSLMENPFLSQASLRAALGDLPEAKETLRHVDAMLQLRNSRVTLMLPHPLVIR
jgi:protease-4